MIIAQHNTATSTKEVVVVRVSSLDQGGPRGDVDRSWPAVSLDLACQMLLVKNNYEIITFLKFE